MAIGLSDLTDGSTGVFDELIDAIETKLDEQYAAGRITGTEYATVYLGALQTTIEQSITFLQIQAQDQLNEAQSTQDLALKQAQQDLLEQQYATEVNNTTVAANTATKVAEEEDLLIEQALKTTAEKELLAQKKLTEVTQELVLDAQIALYTAQSKGFAQKAAYDAAKIAADLWSVSITQGADEVDMPSSGDSGLARGLYNMIDQLYNKAGTDYEYTES